MQPIFGCMATKKCTLRSISRTEKVVYGAKKFGGVRYGGLPLLCWYIILYLFQKLVALGWTFSTAICLSTVFGLYPYWPTDFSCLTEKCYSPAASVLWASFGRLAWSLGVSWIIFACINGSGGFINDFLSWPLFSPLSRLTYAIYLIHMHIIFLYHFKAETPLHFDRYSMVRVP